MVVTYWQGYLAMVHFLDILYFRYKWDGLGGLLGAIDPFIFDDGLPLDQTEVISWLDIIKENDILVEELTLDEAYEAMKKFVIRKNEIGQWKLQDPVDYLSKINKDSQMSEWIDCCLKAISETEGNENN